jgi:hypothetical protein
MKVLSVRKGSLVDGRGGCATIDAMFCILIFAKQIGRGHSTLQLTLATCREIATAIDKKTKDRRVEHDEGDRIAKEKRVVNARTSDSL